MITQKEIHDLAVSKGWWDEYPNPMDRLPESLMLMVTELSECMEEWRVGRDAKEIYYEFAERGTFPATTSLEETRLIGAAFTEDSYIQHGKPAGIPIELADVVIRIRDTCEAMEIDLEAMIELKHKYNKTRSFRHGNKRA